jgi:ornithine cyclodeaminase/alanine dehydrogenase-like protein (mu-crystallin family)
VLILTNDEIATLLSMPVCLEALEQAYAEWAAGRASTRPRSDLYLPFPDSDDFYVFKTMDGGLMRPRIASVRLNSDVIRWHDGPGGPVKSKVPAAPGGTWVGLVLLFSAETGEPLAICPDGVMQQRRVAVTSAIAARRLARADASVVGVLGSGGQAAAHVAAMCAVRPIRAVNIYSPTRRNREALAAKVSADLGIPATAVDSAEAVADADILVAATNALSQVVQPQWLRPGMFLTCVKASELGDATIHACDRIVIHYRKTAPENYVAGRGDEKLEVHDPMARGNPTDVAPPKKPAPAWRTAPELKALVAGEVPGRQSEGEITCFVNSIGTGLQFTALGAALVAQARAAHAGREIPTEWFVERVKP